MTRWILDSDQRYDYAWNLAEIQARKEIAELESERGKLPEKWLSKMVEKMASSKTEDFRRAHWGEYGYDEHKEIIWLEDGLSNDEINEALAKALEEE